VIRESHSIVPYFIEILVAQMAPMIKPTTRIAIATISVSHFE
jgi:hypothetical protein